MQRSRVDIIIPVYNQLELTRQCLESISSSTSIPHRFILVDNGSDGQTAAYLDSCPGQYPGTLVLHNDENRGWVKAVNQGIAQSEAQYLCMMNNDTIVRTSGWLEKLIGVAEAEEAIGLVNPRFDTKKLSMPRDAYIEIDFCRGYCVLMKRLLIQKIGGLDEAYGMGYYDDDDLSVRAIRAGYRCVQANGVFVEHLKDTTFTALFDSAKRSALHEHNKRLFFLKWGRRLRVVFALSGAMDEEEFSRLLFSLARRQHIVHVWRSGKNVGYRHINLREKRFPAVFITYLFWIAYMLNGRKRDVKRYFAIFVDDEKTYAVFKARKANVYLLGDTKKEMDAVIDIIDKAARS